MEAIQDFISGSNAKSTGYSTNTSINTLKRYMNSIGDHREPETIDPSSLNIILCQFFMNIIKTNGEDFEPDSLSTIHRGIARYLASKGYCDIVADERFSETKKVLKAKRKRLRSQGHGNLPNATRELSNDEENMLFEHGYFGVDNPESLINGMWWLISIHYGFRA